MPAAPAALASRASVIASHGAVGEYPGDPWHPIPDFIYSGGQGPQTLLAGGRRYLAACPLQVMAVTPLTVASQER